MAEQSKAKELEEALSYQKKSYYEKANADERAAIFDYAKGYMSLCSYVYKTHTHHVGKTSPGIFFFRHKETGVVICGF